MHLLFAGPSANNSGFRYSPGKMRVAKLRLGILRVEVRASTWLVSYF